MSRVCRAWWRWTCKRLWNWRRFDKRLPGIHQWHADMDPFRLSLLAIGAVLIAAIYLWGRWRRSQSEREDFLGDELPPAPDERSGDDWDIIPLPRHADRSIPMEEAQLKELAGMNGRTARADLSAEEEAAALAAFHDDDIASAVTPQEALLVLTVIAQEGESFTGPTLSDLFEQLDLRYGDMRIFHRIDDASGQPVFSIANALEPGYFELQELPELRTPGLALFMHLPGPQAGTAAFDDFLATARSLAGALEGRIGDQQRRLLNDTTIAQMRTTARHFS